MIKWKFDIRIKIYHNKMNDTDKRTDKHASTVALVSISVFYFLSWLVKGTCIIPRVFVLLSRHCPFLVSFLRNLFGRVATRRPIARSHANIFSFLALSKYVVRQQQKWLLKYIPWAIRFCSGPMCRGGRKFVITMINMPVFHLRIRVTSIWNLVAHSVRRLASGSGAFHSIQSVCYRFSLCQGCPCLANKRRFFLFPLALPVGFFSHLLALNVSVHQKHLK